jgi:thiol-disulfide isomerase/thioredoxin
MFFSIKIPLFTLVLSSIGFLNLHANALGDPAERLKIVEWIQGDPVDITASNDQVIVLEFWATWCAPCRVSIPHLTKLQAKYKNALQIIGVTDEDAEIVRPFLKRMGDQMQYTVARDADRSTYAAYMEAFGQRGIPTAFVIGLDRKILWVGHPMDGLEEALESIFSGSYDLVAAKKAWTERTQREVREEQLEQAFEGYVEALHANESSSIQAKEKQLLAIADEDPEILNLIAWVLFVNKEIPNRNLEFAMMAAEKALKLSDEKNSDILDTYARGLQVTGKLSEAIRYQKLSIKVAESEEIREQLKKTLETYEAELSKTTQEGS